MICLLRLAPGHPAPETVAPIAVRPTPSYAGVGTDVFFNAGPEQAQVLAGAGHAVIRLADGWYEVGDGGIGVWGNGRFWELREPHHTVVRSSE